MAFSQQHRQLSFGIAQCSQGTFGESNTTPATEFAASAMALKTMSVVPCHCLACQVPFMVSRTVVKVLSLPLTLLRQASVTIIVDIATHPSGPKTKHHEDFAQPNEVRKCTTANTCDMWIACKPSMWKSKLAEIQRKRFAVRSSVATTAAITATQCRMLATCQINTLPRA